MKRKKRNKMKLKTKLIIGAVITLAIACIFVVMDQKWKADLKASLADHGTAVQQKENDPKVDQGDAEAQETAEASETSEETGDVPKEEQVREQAVQQIEDQINNLDDSQIEEKAAQWKASQSGGQQAASNVAPNVAQGKEPETTQPTTVAPQAGGTETKPETSQPNNTGDTGGLYFATRQDAINYALSRFTAEEIAIYNQASARGLTPEQEELAIQMAYSRFTSAEIAAIEAGLNR